MLRLSCPSSRATAHGPCWVPATAAGPVPIGEVGKILTETTGIRGLSLLIKEQFGGLKRFVESEHARHRIILGNDHPFNPHLALRSCLGADDLALVDKGVIPMQAILAVKQAVS